MKINKIELLNFGSLTTDEESKELNHESVTGYFLSCSEIKFIDKLDSIAGFIGLKFGIEYCLIGDNKFDETELIDFECRILHPTLINPVSNEKTSETTEIKSAYLFEKNFDYYSFEYDWELKKGIWTFQIIDNEKLLLEKSFEIK